MRMSSCVRDKSRMDGTSSASRSGFSYNVSTVSSAARVILSQRIARFRGLVFEPLDEFCLADDQPCLRPPSNLSPLKVTRSAPSASPIGVRSCGRPNAVISVRAPHPRSTAIGSSCFCASAAKSPSETAAETLNLVITGMDFHQQSGTRSHRSLIVLQVGAVVVPTSTSLAPERAMISGMRKDRRFRPARRGRREPPCDWRASSASITAAALLLTIVAASRRSADIGGLRRWRRGHPPAGFEIKLRFDAPRAVRAMASSAASAKEPDRDWYEVRYPSG